MEIIIIISLLAAGSWFSTYHCIKNKKFYRESASKLSGKVVSWDKHTDKNRHNETYYDIDVLAQNGETYHLSTPRMKARKYKNKQDIYILVPDVYLTKDETFAYINELTQKEKDNTLNELENEKLKSWREIQENCQQINNFLNTESKNMIKIEEEINSRGELYLSVFMGVILTLLTIAVIIILII